MRSFRSLFSGSSSSASAQALMAVTILSARYSASPLVVSCVTRVVTARSRSSWSAVASLDLLEGEGIWIKLARATARSLAESASWVASSNFLVSFAWRRLSWFCFLTLLRLACFCTTFCCESLMAVSFSSRSRASGMSWSFFESCRHASASSRSFCLKAYSPAVNNCFATLFNSLPLRVCSQRCTRLGCCRLCCCW